MKREKLLNKTSTTSIDGDKPGLDIGDVIKRCPASWEIILKDLEGDINDIICDVWDVFKKGPKVWELRY